jgi:hypothetical protein
MLNCGEKIVAGRNSVRCEENVGVVASEYSRKRERGQCLLQAETFRGECIVDHEGAAFDSQSIRNEREVLRPIGTIGNGSLTVGRAIEIRRQIFCWLIGADLECVVAAALASQNVHDPEKDIVAYNSNAAVMTPKEFDSTEIDILAIDLKISTVDKAEAPGRDHCTIENCEL